MADFLDDLTSFWKEKGVAAAPHKATKEEIEAWERRYNVILPADLREYVTRVNGVQGGESLEFDHDLLSFLPLSAMCTEAEWTKAEGQSGMFVFADYCISCYWWCVQLDNSPHEYTRIFFGGGPKKNILLANSLSEFFDMYRNHPKRLHGQ